MNAANAAATAITSATNAEQAALRAYNDTVVLPSSSLPDITELADVRTALTAANTALTAANTGLNGASTALIAAAEAMHMGFQIRAPVSPGDSEYIVVVASQNPVTALNVNVQFHGAIDAATSAASITGALRAGAVPTYTLHISAPGLLTVETTGSTDTVGTFYDNDRMKSREAESGGSGDNFKIVAPVPANGTGSKLYADCRGTNLDDGRGLHLGHGLQSRHVISDQSRHDHRADGGDSGRRSSWTGTSVAADDTMLQIQRRAADGSVADEDYFLLTVGE